MSGIAGCDPGLTGAIAVLWADGRADVWPNPMEQRVVNKKLRATPDVHGTLEHFQVLVGLGVEKLYLEAVHGMPGQSGSTQFNFGYGYGVLRTAALAAGMTVELIQPQAWKGRLKAPADKKASVARATELMPQHRALWHGKGGLIVNSGKAEAVMIALYGVKHG